jgi:integrase
LNALFTWAIEAEHATANPVRDVPKVRWRSDGHHTWTLGEMRQFEQQQPIGTQARLAMALLAFTGQRRSDVVNLGRQHLTKDGGLKFTQVKNKNRNPVVVEIPILPELRRVIDASPTGSLTFLLNKWGRPMSADDFSRKMREWCDEASLTHCSAHGLRKAAACAAEGGAGGASEMQMMAIFGWRDPNQARVYTQRANRGKMAAESMHLLAIPQNAEGTVVSHFAAHENVGEKKRKKL